MNLLEQRLSDLWLRQTTPCHQLEPEQRPFPNRMGVTFRAPTKISGTMLMPGRYVFELPDPGKKPNHVEIFNGDETKLVAHIMFRDLQSSDGGWEAMSAGTSRKFV
jgi:hypothetical protein